jgi:hypothetical protein
MPLSLLATILELLFSCNGVADVCAVLVVDQLLTAIISGEPRNLSGTMLANSARQIICYANIEYSVMIIGHDVDPKVIVP